MTTEELYYEFHLLVNKNNSQGNINIEKPHFVQLFNREYDRWIYSVIQKKNKDFFINDIQELIVSNAETKLIQKRETFDIYDTPNDFFNYIECKIEASKEEETKTLFVYEIKPREVNVFQQDEFSSPSFEWEETFLTQSDNKLIVYKSDFEIEKLFLTYYKAPEQIELAGYVTLFGKASVNKDIKLSSVYQRQILDGVVKEVMREYENQMGFQLAQERKVE